MLTYTFWHSRDPRAEDREYVARLTDFHRVFTKTRPAGYLETVVSRIRGAPWIADGGEAFEEWYILDGSAALDVINHAAVSGACLAPHNEVARIAAAGTAGLYLRRLGDSPESEMRFAQWFAKPAGLKYAELYAQMGPLLAKHGAALWGRQMVLGPTPEFC